ncbi:MAG: DUF3422 domain-containing protein [Rhodospirillaceae bacterium]
MNDQAIIQEARAVPLTQHPLRHQLAAEVHARPYEVLDPPVRATHLAVATGEGTTAADRAHLEDLCDRYGVLPPPPGAIHFAHDLGPDLRVRWERHTEFSTYTFYRFDAFTQPFAERALDLVPGDWLAGMPGAVLVALHAALIEGDPAPDLNGWFGDHLVVGSRIGAGAGVAWSDFRIHEDGFSRIVVNAGTLTRGQNGRMLQRLMELETYRMMALLAFPVARDMAPRLSRLEREVGDLTGRMATAASDDGESERALLRELTRAAAEVESLMAAHGYRFSAARAYHALVQRSLRELREERIGGTQMFHEFMDRRFAPAMRTCEAMESRADGLGRRIARAADMLRTRVDIAMEESNRDLLRSMNSRVHMQLRLQETVEGLSVVAISYYLWGLVAYLLKGLKASGVPLDPDAAALIAIPVVVGLVFIGVRRLRKAVGHRHED